MPLIVNVTKAPLGSPRVPGPILEPRADRIAGEAQQGFSLAGVEAHFHLSVSLCVQDGIVTG
jgi:hypothetical protein